MAVQYLLILACSAGLGGSFFNFPVLFPPLCILNFVLLSTNNCRLAFSNVVDYQLSLSRIGRAFCLSI